MQKYEKPTAVTVAVNVSDIIMVSSSQIESETSIEITDLESYVWNE